MKFEFKKLEQPIYTSEFWYDLTDGGYLRPEKTLINPDQIKALNQAIDLILEYEKQANNQNIFYSEW